MSVAAESLTGRHRLGHPVFDLRAVSCASVGQCGVKSILPRQPP